MAKKNGQAVRRAAKEVAEIMAASLAQFSKAEQDRRLKAIHKVALSAGARKRGKSSKRLRTRASRPSRRLRAAS